MGRLGRQPEALVLTGYGINCDYETQEACARAGFSAHRSHLNDVIADPRSLFRNKLVVFPGGFSFGDDLGSGVAFASKVRYAAAGGERRLIDLFGEYVEKGGLVLGICNGFQILVRMGLVPALDGMRGAQEVTLAPNREGYYIDRWVRLLVEEDSPNVFTRGLKTLSLPVRHGEGRFIPADDAVMARIEERRLVALRYCDERGRPTMEFPQNPNGSAAAVAGVCDPSGRVFGLMPHPEAAVSMYQLPDWTLRREEARRKGELLVEEGDGSAIFKNARAHVD
jgi:phosphoribosylformylglycinamidine synthase